MDRSRLEQESIDLLRAAMRRDFVEGMRAKIAKMEKELEIFRSQLKSVEMDEGRKVADES